MMDKQTKVTDLTEDFFRASVVVDDLIDTSRAVIPAPRSAEQVIVDQVNYFASTMTAKLRSELRADIDQAMAELDALKAERQAATDQRRGLEAERNMLRAECAAVRDARRMLQIEIDGARRYRYQRDGTASAICTPSRQNMTGR
jgi:hypothetical protein